MIADTGSTTPQTDQEWAAAALELPESISHAGRLGQVLEKLERVEFMPTREWREAIDVLATGSTTQTAMRGHRRAKLAERIKGFLKAYWYIPIKGRRKQHQALLADAAAFPEIQRVLKSTESGLAVDWDVLKAEKDPALKELGWLVCTQYLLAQQARVRSRRHWQSQHTKQQQRQLAKRLKSRYPAIAALEAEWIKQLRRGKTCLVPRKPISRKLIGKMSDAVDALISSDGGKVLLIILGTLVGVWFGVNADPTPPSRPPYRFEAPVPKYQYQPYKPPRIEPHVLAPQLEAEIRRSLMEKIKSEAERVQNETGRSELESMRIAIERLNQRNRWSIQMADPKPAIAEKP